jgi:hypothetical protein
VTSYRLSFRLKVSHVERQRLNSVISWTYLGRQVGIHFEKLSEASYMSAIPEGLAAQISPHVGEILECLM